MIHTGDPVEVEGILEEERGDAPELERAIPLWEKGQRALNGGSGRRRQALPLMGLPNSMKTLNSLNKEVRHPLSSFFPAIARQSNSA